MEVGRQLGKHLDVPAQVDWTFFTSFRPLVDFRTGLSPAVMARICVFFIFAFFKKKIYRNIFLGLGFTVLYPYRPAGGAAGGLPLGRGAVGASMR